MIPSIEFKAGLPAFSALVYGAWRMADGADTSAQTALKKIKLCLDLGITTFDHADIYGDYRCEALFGEALKLDPGLKRQMQIVTKCGIKLISATSPERRVKHYDTSAAHIRQSVDNSLRLLGVERLDTLLILRPGDDVEPVLVLVERGQVRIEAREVGPDTLKECLFRSSWRSVRL